MSDRFGLLFDDTFADDLAGAGERLDFLEIIPDRYFGTEPPPIPTALPVTMHSLNLSLGAQEPLDRHYVAKLRASAQHLKPIWASDHLAVSHVGGMDLGMLSPVRCSAAAAAQIADKVSELQDKLQIPFLVENIATYIVLPGNEFSEPELLDRVVRTSGCGLLLDINNVVVNAANYGLDPYAYLCNFPLHAVREIHIAGHHEEAGVHLDSHAEPVGEQVWEALRFVAQRIGPVSILLERDDNIPPLDELLAELATAQRVVQEAETRPGPDAFRVSQADCIPLRTAGGEACWLASKIRASDHIHQLTQAECDELEAALRKAVADGWNPVRADAAHFALGAFASTLAKWRHRLETGSGFCIFRGIPVQRYAPRERALLLCGIGAHLGRIMPQNARGELLNHVRAKPGARQRGYQSGTALPFHSDPCDLVGLLCLRPAESGGESAIASTHAIHDALLDRRPDLLQTLYQPFHIERHEASPHAPPFYTTPVFMWHEGELFSRFNPGYIFSAQRHPQTPKLTPEQIDAIETFEQLCHSDPFRLDAMLEPGDLQFLNNHWLVHSRSAYQDHKDPALKRHLLRLWLCASDAEHLPSPMRDLYRDMERWRANACLPPEPEDEACG